MKSWIFTISLLILFFAPGAAFSPTEVLGKAVQRIETPLTDVERGELEFLNCLEQTGSVIPDMAKVYKSIPDDSYIVQRVGDIYYPRVRFVDDESKAEFTLIVNMDSGGRNIVASQTCGGAFVGVAKND